MHCCAKTFFLYVSLHLCWNLFQAIDHIINSAAKSNYMSAGQINVPIVFRGPNGAAAGVGAQHSQVNANANSVQHTFSFTQKKDNDNQIGSLALTLIKFSLNK